MTKPTEHKTFAELCMQDLKELIAREIRKQITENRWKYAVAVQIFNVDSAAISRIMNHKEHRMSFETLHKAAVSAGITVSMQLCVPK